MKSRVAVVRCSSYNREEVEQAVETAIKLLGGFEKIFAEEIEQDSEIILKPNLLAKAAPEKAVTTHPEVFRAVGKLLQDNGYTNLKYGDSPGNPMFSLEKTASDCGIKQAADELGIPAGDFEHGTKTEFPEGHVAKQFVLCNEIARVTGNAKTSEGSSSGGIINICKMKTHQLERITGAVKNTFGCVFGVNKAATHAVFKSPEHFARMLADLNNLVVPKLHIMDGIVAMEGNGPGSGDPIPMSVILASTDPVALDTTFCHLICLDAELVATNVAAAEAGVGTMADEEIEVLIGGMPMQPEGAVTSLDDLALKYGEKNFNVQRSIEYRGGFRIMRLLDPLLTKKPVIIADKCIGCGICVETCPVGADTNSGKAINLNTREADSQMNTKERKVAVYDYDKCIRCYCCQEMCPEKAIAVKKSLLAKIIDRRWKV